MLVQLDTENADRDLTSPVTVLTDTPDASNPMQCQAVVYLGDGAKDLDGTGGDFEMTITVGDQIVQPDPQIITVKAGAVQAAMMSVPFAVPANTEVLIKVKSPNGADSDVDTTAYLYDSLPTTLITGDAGDTLESLANQLGQITNTGAATNTVATSDSAVATGTVDSGTYESVEALDGVYWQISDDGAEIDMFFEFNVGTTGVPVSVQHTGRINSNNDSLDVFGYNWGTASWVQIGTLDGQATSVDQVRSFDLFTSMVGTGANAGKVRVRFYAASGLTSAVFYTDQIFCSYSVVTSPVGYANGAIWIDTNNGTAGTVVGVNGVADLPVNTWADALTLSASTGLTKFVITNSSSITLTGDSSDLSFYGENWLLDMDGQIISGTYIHGASISGVGVDGGTPPVFENCEMGTVSLPGCGLRLCSLTDVTTLTENSNYYFDRCRSDVAGFGTPILNFGPGVGNTNVNFRHYSGGIEVKNMGATGTDKMSLEGHGQYILNANCTGGELAVRGHFKKTDNSGGAVTIDDDANFFSSVITSGFAQAGGATTITLASGASAVNGAYVSQLVFIKAGTGLNQVRAVLSYVGATKVATVDRAWDTNPDATSVYSVLLIGSSSIVSVGANAVTSPNDFKGSGLDAQATRDSMKLAPTAGAPAADSIDADLALIVEDTNEIQSKLPTNEMMGSSDKADQDGKIDLILEDTGSTLQSQNALIYADTNVAIPALINGLNNLSAAEAEAACEAAFLAHTIAQLDGVTLDQALAFIAGLGTNDVPSGAGTGTQVGKNFDGSVTIGTKTYTTDVNGNITVATFAKA